MADEALQKAQSASDTLRSYGERAMRFLGYGGERKPRNAEEARAQEAGKRSRAERDEALGEYRNLPRGTISSTSEYGEPKREQYHRGGKIRKTGKRGKDRAIVAKEGERVLTEKQDRDYQRMKRRDKGKRGKRRSGRRS